MIRAAMRSWFAGTAVACVACLVGCGSTGTRAFQYPAVATGQAALPIETDAYSLQLTRAKLAYGPAYFCQTAAASPELCPVAQAEILTVATIDLLDPAAQPIGQVDSLAGSVGTTTYDLGWSWFARDSKPRLADGVEHSAEIGVTLTRKADGQSRDLTMAIDLVPTIAGTRTVGATKVSATIDDASWQLHVTADARAWWLMVDPAELDALPAEMTAIPDTTRAAAAIRQQITSGRPLQFTWERQ